MPRSRAIWLAGCLLAVITGAPPPAKASLISYDFYGRVMCGGQFICGPQYGIDTGSTTDPTLFTGRMTIDTSVTAPDSTYRTYTFDSSLSGTGLSITIANLTLFYGDFSFSIFDSSGVFCPDTADGFVIQSNKVLLPFTTCGSGGPEDLLGDRTLDAFAAAPMQGYRIFGDAFIGPPGAPWLADAGVSGRLSGIVRVTEPRTLGLVMLGLVMLTARTHARRVRAALRLLTGPAR